MPSWWGNKSSKEVKKKSNVESILSSLHRKYIRPRRQRSDQSRADSKQVQCCHNFDERVQAQPLPIPGTRFTKGHAIVGEGDTSNSSDTTYTDTDDSSDDPAVLLNPSNILSKTSDFLLNIRTGSASPNQRPVNSDVALESLMSSPSRSPMRVFGHEPVTNSGHCPSPGSVHNSVTGDTPCQLFWPQGRLSPECSPFPSPRMTSPGLSSRVQSGGVTPRHPRSGTESPTSWPLPLPPVKISIPSPFTTPPYSTVTSPRIPRSPSRTDCWKKGRLLGRGTFGHVYLGFNSDSGEMCAMKEVTLFSDDSKSRESAQQLGQEISLLSRLRHPNIVQYYGSEMVDNKLYIYLEYVSGGSIHRILQEYGQLGEAAIRSYTQQILCGLVYLHAKNTLHRDIKGANILVDPNGRVRLADFGMAKHISGKSCPLSFKGSPYWMAPEVIKNSSGCNLAVDIWSLGCTVLEMATTKPPWSQYEGVAAMFKVGNSKELPEIPDHLSDEGKDFVMKCLQRDPSHRPTAAQLLEHPFVRNSCSLERSVPSAEHLESIHALNHAVNAFPQCLDTSGAVNHSQSPKTVHGFSDGYMVRNKSCPVSPSRNYHPQSPPPQHIQGRLSPSPISNPRAASGTLTPPGGASKGTISPKTTNNFNKPNIFRRVLQKARSSVETFPISPEYDFLGNDVERPLSPKEQLYDAHLVLADRVSQQLLGNPIRQSPGLELKPSSTMPSRNNDFVYV
ncbi:mitogen-activated protein kinase kinase kinase yoda [Phtheirospermum japonicum]|uniref:mitogen-activated protein kinase kinase kinase n=1 Tax=Phtheirospermum japonicum TaxID=374723 RepID=A0A830BMZ4_9LAMI|nr:mitogen-activated protein kinase kinase kinase yoda [Phtheirospermum japonicum]